MDHDEKKDSIVTFVENPSHLHMDEVADAQNESQEDSQEIFEEDLDVESVESDEEDMEDPELLSESSESLDDQMEKLAKALEKQAEESTDIETLQPAAPVDLEAQIAEDQALEKELSETPEPAILSEEIPFDQAEIQACIEAILFLSEKPLSAEKLRELLGPTFSIELFVEALENLKKRYLSPHHGIELLEVAGGYQFRTKPGKADLAKKLVKIQTQRLSTGGMETLAIIAYKQPIMKEEVDKIRGVDSSYFIRGLLEKKLIKISGRSELPGRPILYSTTTEFLEIFGMKDLYSLPSLRELEQMIPNSQSSPQEEDPKIREMRRLVGEMKSDQSTSLIYNPKEDEKILKEIREKVTAIPTSTPYLDELKAAELLAQQQAAAVETAAPVSPTPAAEEPKPIPIDPN